MKFKKLAAIALTACLTVPTFSTVVSAAQGSLMFTDPETKVGDTVDVDLVVRSTDSAVGDADVTMSYDTSALEFVSGDGVEADGSGKLTYSGSGDGTQTELRTTMQFRALKAGDATISVDESTAYLYNDETLTLDEGSSAIKIDAADDGSTTAEASAAGETTDITVTVNGTDYNFSEAFTSADIPEGYSETTMTFNGEDHKFVKNDGGIVLGFLVDSDGAGKFFLYNESDATFSPYTEIKISDTTSIVLLSNTDDVSLPSSYQQGELTIADESYPYWADPTNEKYDIVYAVNTRTGEKGFYQYDTEDGTYQSFDAPTANSKKNSGNSVIDKIGNFMADHTLIVVVAGGVVGVVLLILMIVFAIKLAHRNQELDDLYDEYDIPFDDDEDEVEEKSGKGLFGRKKKDEDDEEDDYDDYDDDYDDEYDDDDYDDDDYDDDDEYDDDDYDDEPVSGKTQNLKKAGKSKKSKKASDDDYDVDFIDL